MGPPGRGWLRAGVVGSPHGLDGSFHVSQPTPDLLSVGTDVRIGERELKVLRRAGSDRQVIVRVESYSDREAAQSLRGLEIYVEAEVTALGPDEWWAEDLEGCLVHGLRNEELGGRRVLGTVRRLIALPSCEALEVARPDREAEVLVPLVRDAVRKVDLERREIEVDLEFLGEA